MRRRGGNLGLVSCRVLWFFVSRLKVMVVVMRCVGWAGRRGRGWKYLMAAGKVVSSGLAD